MPGKNQMIYPAVSKRTSCTFGMRSNPTGAGSQFHVGTDFPVSTGTPVKATASGTVVFAGVHSTGGNRVEIDHGHGVVTAYSHNSQFTVSVGDTVERSEERRVGNERRFESSADGARRRKRTIKKW